MLADKDIYLRIIDNHPFKLSPEEAEYRKSEGPERCDKCIHFYVRKTDGFTVCEVVRPTEDGNEEPISPNYVCRFTTDDGENFPLLDE